MLNEKGQTLLELIVVMSVCVLVVGALVFATIASLRNAQFAKNQAQATKLAQEGLERVRVGRDRNSSITIPGTNVVSWNGDELNTGTSVWESRITDNCGSSSLPTYCYLNVSSGGVLSYAGVSRDVPANAEPIVPNFKRAIIIDDDSPNSKKLTAVVVWTDFSGTHESRLTTILRNQNQ